jgi:hypothetical protein
LRPKNKHSGETPPTFLQKNEFLEIPKGTSKTKNLFLLTTEKQRTQRKILIGIKKLFNIIIDFLI